MPPFELTLDAQVQVNKQPGYFHRYDSLALVRNLNPVADAVSPQAFWYDKASNTLMLTPEQLNASFLNTAAQLPYVMRLSQFTVNPSNASNTRVFEANFMQNPNNPFIHHTPCSPTFPAFVDSPEQVPGITALPAIANDPSLVSTGPTGPFPGVGSTDAKVICWTSNPLPWNMPLYFRWWTSPSAAGHILIYLFWVGQFCIAAGPQVVEVFRDTSPNHNRLTWQSVCRLPLFGGQPESTGFFSGVRNFIVKEVTAGQRAFLWLPYRRNYVYLESSEGRWGVFKANPGGAINQGNTTEWGIVESRNLVVGALTPGPGLFQIQKVKFPAGSPQFNLEPFVLDYTPDFSPTAAWLIDDRDTPMGSTLTHTTPATPPPYTFVTNNIDYTPPAMTIPGGDDPTRAYGSVYTLTPGTDPTNPSLKTYTPFLYGVEAKVPNESFTWPKAAVHFNDRSAAAPSARIKHAEIHAEIGEPGHFTAEVEDLGTSLSAYYFRSEFPMQFSDANGNEGNPAAWTTLWEGVAEPVQTRERRLDSTAGRDIRFVGTDFWKWLNETIMRDTRDWTGFGHITVMQQIMLLAGLSVAGWDGPAPGTIVQQSVDGQVRDVFKPDAAGYDDPLGGLPGLDPMQADGTTDSLSSQPVRSVWRPLPQPPDSFGSFMKRIAEKWSGWDYGFHPDGTFYYHKWDYYTASEATFYKDTTHDQTNPHYLRGSVRYDPLYPDANAIVVLGATPGGSGIASSKFVDLPSELNPAAVNFIGREKQLVLALPGAISADAMNKSARAIFERARRRHLRVHFQATYLPTLKIGHCHTLEGISGVWRLQSVSAQYLRKGFDLADYSSELVEVGHA
jgi:hypothetical protein